MFIVVSVALFVWHGEFLDGLRLEREKIVVEQALAKQARAKMVAKEEVIDSLQYFRDPRDPLDPRCFLSVGLGAATGVTLLVSVDCASIPPDLLRDVFSPKQE